jgi:hypothetical protein
LIVLNLFNIQKYNTDIIEFKLLTNDITHEIKQILSSEESCKSTFNNFDFHPKVKQLELEIMLNNHEQFSNGINVINQRGAKAQIKISKDKEENKILLKGIRGIFTKGDFLDIGKTFNTRLAKILTLKTIENMNAISTIKKYRSQNKKYIPKFNLHEKNNITKNIQQYVFEFTELESSTSNSFLKRALFKIYFNSQLKGLQSRDLIKIIPLYFSTEDGIIQRCSTRPFNDYIKDQNFLFMLGNKTKDKGLEGLTGNQACAKYSKKCAWMEMCIGYSPYDFEKHAKCYREKTKRGHVFLSCTKKIKFSSQEPSSSKLKDDVCRDHTIAYCTN